MTAPRRTLKSTVVRFTWCWVIVFIPIETYLSFRREAIPVSGYAVNVLGVGIMVWALVCLRRGRPYAAGLLATGWAWTTAVFWRATNLRYAIAGDGEPLDFGNLELWLAPACTVLAGAALAGSLVLLIRGSERDL